MTAHPAIAIRSALIRGARVALLFLGLLMVLGCGLGEYEQLMDKERDRVKVFDEENRLLGKPLKMPTVMPTQGKPEEQPALLRMTVFLRPPKGVSSVCADKDDKKMDKAANTTGIPLFRYTGADGDPLKNILLAGDMGTFDTPRFEEAVLSALADYTRMPLTKKDEVGKVVKTPLQSPSAKPRPIAFHALALDEPPGTANPSRYLVYFHRSGKYQVSVIYQVPPDLAPDLSKAIDFSLKTLGIGPKDAAEQQKAYVERLAYFPSIKG